MHALLEAAEQREALSRAEAAWEEYLVTAQMQYVENYNEQIKDLLEPEKTVLMTNVQDLSACTSLPKAVPCSIGYEGDYVSQYECGGP